MPIEDTIAKMNNAISSLNKIVEQHDDILAVCIEKNTTIAAILNRIAKIERELGLHRPTLKR